MARTLLGAFLGTLFGKPAEQVGDELTRGDSRLGVGHDGNATVRALQDAPDLIRRKQALVDQLIKESDENGPDGDCGALGINWLTSARHASSPSTR